MNTKKLNPEFLKRAPKVRLLLMDCDGVLTDGRLFFSSQGEAMKIFDVRDGQGIADWHRAGNFSGIITGRASNGILEIRAQELGINFLRTSVIDKSSALDEILRESNMTEDETAYIGDDIPDLPVLRRVHLPMTVNDGVDALDEFCVYKTEANGGRGAIREITDILLNLRNV